MSDYAWRDKDLLAELTHGAAPKPSARSGGSWRDDCRALWWRRIRTLLLGDEIEADGVYICRDSHHIYIVRHGAFRYQMITGNSVEDAQRQLLDEIVNPTLHNADGQFFLDANAAPGRVLQLDAEAPPRKRQTPGPRRGSGAKPKSVSQFQIPLFELEAA